MFSSWKNDEIQTDVFNCDFLDDDENDEADAMALERELTPPVCTALTVMPEKEVNDKNI